MDNPSKQGLSNLNGPLVGGRLSAFRRHWLEKKAQTTR